MSKEIKVMDKSNEVIAYDKSRLEMGKETIMSAGQFRSIVNKDVFKKNVRHSENYTDGSLRSLALALDMSKGNRKPIRLAEVAGEMRVTDGNRRTAVILHEGNFDFSEGKGTDKQTISVSASSWNVLVVYEGVISEEQYLQAVTDQLLQKPLSKGEKFDIIHRFIGLGYNEARIKRATGMSAGVVQPAIRAAKVASTLQNAKLKIAEKIKDSKERVSAIASINGLEEQIIADYKEGRLSADKVNDLGKIVTQLTDSSLKKDAVEGLEKSLIAAYEKESKDMPVRKWADIEKDILPNVHYRFAEFAKAIKNTGDIDLLSFKSLEAPAVKE